MGLTDAVFPGLGLASIPYGLTACCSSGHVKCKHKSLPKTVKMTE